MSKEQQQQPSRAYTRKDLENYILELMDIKDITPMITKQINKYMLDYKMSFKEIARCLCYCDEVLQLELRPAFGIAMVPNIREEAAKYFKKLELDQRNREVTAQRVVEYQDNNIIFNIKALPRKKKKPKQFNIAEVVIPPEEEGKKR